MKNGEPVDPGPGYRWATRSETVTALILDLGNLLLAAVAGAIVGCLTFALVAWGIPLLLLNVSPTTDSGAKTSEFANVIQNGTHGLLLIGGLIAGAFAAVVFLQRVLRALPMHSGPVRPVVPELED